MEALSHAEQYSCAQQRKQTGGERRTLGSGHCQERASLLRAGGYRIKNRLLRSCSGSGFSSEVLVLWPQFREIFLPLSPGTCHSPRIL